MGEDSSHTETVLRNCGIRANLVPNNSAYVNSDDDDELHSLPTTKLLRGTSLKRTSEPAIPADNSFFGVASSPIPGSKIADNDYLPSDETPILRLEIPPIPDPSGPHYYSQETIDRYATIVKLKKAELADLRRVKMQYDNQLVDMQIYSRQKYSQYLSKREELQSEMQAIVQRKQKFEAANAQVLGRLSADASEISRLESQKDLILNTKDVYEHKILRLRDQITVIAESRNHVSSEKRAQDLCKLAEIDELSTEIDTIKADTESTNQKVCTLQKESELWPNEENKLQNNLDMTVASNLNVKTDIEAEKTQLTGLQSELVRLTVTQQKLETSSQDLARKIQSYELALPEAEKKIQEERQNAKEYLEHQQTENDQSLSKSRAHHQLQVEEATNALNEILSAIEKLRKQYTELSESTSRATQNLWKLQQRNVDWLEKQQELCTKEKNLKAKTEKAKEDVKVALAHQQELRDRVCSLKEAYEDQNSQMLAVAKCLEIEACELNKYKNKQERLSKQNAALNLALIERGTKLNDQDRQQTQEADDLESQYNCLRDKLRAAEQAREKEILRRIEIHKSKQVEARLQAKVRHDADFQEFQELQQVRLRLLAELKALDAAAVAAAATVAAAKHASTRNKRPALRYQ